MKKYDVIVVGGGFAGCAAAITAAENGCSVLLLEQSGALGGAANNCLILPFMSNGTRIENENGENKYTELSRGLFEKIKNRLSEKEALSGGTFHEEYLKLILDEMTADAGVEVLFHSTLCEATKENLTVKSVTVITKTGKLTFEAGMFIDCTGDADLAVMASCPYRLGREKDSLCQPMTLCFRVANVNTDILFAPGGNEKMQEIYKRAQADGRTSNPRENVLWFRTLINGVIHFNTTRVVRLDPTDPFDLSKAEREARKQMFELFEILKAEHPAFYDSSLLSSAAFIGVRESRMITGKHILTSEELKNCVRFPDAVAAGNYDIDIHNPEGSGTSHYYFPEGQYYTIPFASLVPLNADNLICAGRCISSTHEAQASYRIMPIVCCLGEAAGAGAAVCLKNGTSPADADTEEIRSILLKRGAFIG